MHYRILCCLTLLAANAAVAQRFETKAIDNFWTIVDALKQDRPLTDSMWGEYYNLPGNKNYIENNRSPEQAKEHRKYLEFVFRPSMTDSMAILVKRSASTQDDILKNLLYIRAHEKELRTYTPVIISGSYLNICRTLAKSYLPKEGLNPVPENLTIYINALTFDAAVQSPDMYFGLSIVYEFDRFQKGAIAAHELHHQLRPNKEIQKAVSHADSTSFSIVSQVNNEGTADLVDKTVALKNKNKLFDAVDEMHWIFDDAETTIRRLDSALLVNAAGVHPLSYRDFRKITLYSSGHIPGFFMTHVISRNGGQSQLIAHCDNPFNVFYLYNAAAKKDKQHPPVFSNSAIAYLKQLEARVY